MSLRLVGVLLVTAAVVVFASARFVENRTGRKWFFGSGPAIELPGGGAIPGGAEPLIFPKPAVPQRTETQPAQAEPVQVPRPRVEKPVEQAKPAAPQGTNVIVIQTYMQRKDLEPVQQHFSKGGIETEIVERGSYFFLVTKQLYLRCSVDSNSFNPKYDGDVARQKIKEVGATYRAPPGYESFRPNLFQDAYAEKVR
ncbi:MAG: hypothetical protein IH624_20080 [Phycisphaerae bacterium]|nr:hypothetical protein [Phycisphaerae bacterium]